MSVTEYITNELYRDLSTRNPSRQIGRACLEWASIVAAAALCLTFWNPLVYIITIMWIGCRQHALLILAHDCMHSTFHRNRRFGDLYADLLLLWPIVFSIHSARKIHLAHHANTNKPGDPDWERNRPDRLAHSSGLWATLLMFAGLSNDKKEVAILDWFKNPEAGNKSLGAYSLIRLGYYLLALLLIVYFSLFEEFLLFWIVPWCTWFLVTLRLRGLLEHWGVSNKNSLNNTRSTMTNWFGRWFLIPGNINYHVEHHLYPAIPYFNLPKLQKILLQNKEFEQEAHISYGYFSSVKELFDFPKSQQKSS